MPKGYPETQTCKHCGEGLPIDYAYCPMCGNPLFKEPRPKKELVQLLNPRSHRYVVIDRGRGRIVKHGRTSKPYKNIPIINSETAKKE